MSKHHFLSSFLLCGLLGITGTIATIPLNLPSAIAQPIPTDENQNAIADRLYGFWKVIEPNDDETEYIWFSPNGEFAILDTFGSTTIDRYQINPNTQPKQLDILGEEGLVLSIFEFTPSGQLRLEVENANWNQFRPTEFSLQPTLLEKVTNNSPIIYELQARVNETIYFQEKEEVQREAQETLRAMSRAQQAYRLESPNFADTMDELRTSLPPETEDYRYEIVSQPDRQMGVMMTATAKQPDLKSYANFIYIQNDGSTSLLMCETNEPATVPPEIIVNFNGPLEPVRCRRILRQPVNFPIP